MSDIRANTISDAAGTGPIDLYKQSAAKAHFSHSQTSINQSFNISSIEDHSAGNIKGYYTSAMSSATNPLVGGNNNTSSGGAHNYSTGFSSVSTATYYWVQREYANGNPTDMDIFSGATLGELA
jgi:hypothetical protein